MLTVEGRSEVFNRDNGIRQTSLEQLMRLKPAYPDSAPDPTMTAGNCTFPVIKTCTLPFIQKIIKKKWPFRRMELPLAF